MANGVTSLTNIITNVVVMWQVGYGGNDGISTEDKSLQALVVQTTGKKTLNLHVWANIYL